jgi:hypothetical protein
MTARRAARTVLALLGLLALLAAAAGCAPTTPRPVTRPSRPAGGGPGARTARGTPPAPPPAGSAPAGAGAAAPAAPPGRPVTAPAPLRVEPVGEAALVSPILLKVGLASDLAAVSLPCCEAGLRLSVAEKVVAAVAPLRVEPAAGGTQQGLYRLQAAALRDERQAQDLARRL